jgi:hypothetical protein
VPTDNKLFDDIKRLLILLFCKLGSTSDEITQALDVDPSAVRKMMLIRQIKPLKISKS